jgi:hypothetical protein
MSESSDQDEFVARFLEGSLSDAELSEASPLVSDAELADRIVRNSLIQELLLKAGSEIGDVDQDVGVGSSYSRNDMLPTADRRKSQAVSSRRSLARRGVLSALVACIALLAAYTGWRVIVPTAQHRGPAIAKVSRSVNASWKQGERRWAVGDSLHPGDRVDMQDGRAELQFEHGAVMVIDGAVSLELVSAQSVSLIRGAATTRLNKAKSGSFDVQTPSARVVDLGTEFGVRVQDDGKTDVVVFEGAVDLRLRDDVDSVSSKGRRLDVGEALHLQANGTWERLVSVPGDSFPTANRLYPVTRTREPVITSISDNRRPGDKPKFYRICHEGLVEDARAFVDFPYEWNGLTEEGLPSFLRGADYVQTFNTDRKEATLNITVGLAGPAIIYVLYDNRLLIPEWLSADFEDTGVDIGLDEQQGTLRAFRTPLEVGGGKGIDQTCSVWAQRVDQGGEVVVGPIAALKPEFAEAGRTMLGIAAQPLAPSPHPAKADAAE